MSFKVTLKSALKYKIQFEILIYPIIKRLLSLSKLLKSTGTMMCTFLLFLLIFLKGIRHILSRYLPHIMNLTYIHNINLTVSSEQSHIIKRKLRE